MTTRRQFVALGAAALLAACTRAPRPDAGAAGTPDTPDTPADPGLPGAQSAPPWPDFYAAITDEPYPVPAVPVGSVPPRYRRQRVANPWPDLAPGTIIVDPDAALLHFIESPATAMRYGVSVGAEGFAWSGRARLQFARAWPHWKVPDAMIERQPELAPYSWRLGGMPPGPDNPMGARALYLFQNGRDTLYRIHGSASPAELGKAVSSGCIRMLDQDVIDLHARAPHGATVIVRPSMRPRGLDVLY